MRVSLSVPLSLVAPLGRRASSNFWSAALCQHAPCQPLVKGHQPQQPKCFLLSLQGVSSLARRIPIRLYSSCCLSPYTRTCKYGLLAIGCHGIAKIEFHNSIINTNACDFPHVARHCWEVELIFAPLFAFNMDLADSSCCCSSCSCSCCCSFCSGCSCMVAAVTAPDVVPAAALGASPAPSQAPWSSDIP